MPLDEAIIRTSSSAARATTVLVLSGTGVSMWMYYQFLRRFSTKELSEFAHIYGISGGAVCAWFRVLQDIGIFDEHRIASYDATLRTLNQQSLLQRIWRLLRNEYVYDTLQMAEGVETFAGAEARRLTFQDFPLANFTAVAYDSSEQSVAYLNRDSVPGLAMGDAMAAISVPRTVCGRRFFKPLLSNPQVSDFDFAPVAVRRQFKERIRTEHRDQNVLWLNVRFTLEKRDVVYLNMNSDCCPRLGQLWDITAFFLNMPNNRIRFAATRK